MLALPMKISTVITALQLLSGMLFLGVGVLAFREWRRSRERSQVLIALAVGLLGAVSLIGRIDHATGWFARVLSGLTIVGLLGSSSALMEFRHIVVPLHARARRAIHGAALAVGVPALFVQWPKEPDVWMAPWKALIAWGIILLWMGTMLEPAIRFARAARTRRAIERARLRLLSAAYFGALAILAFGLVGPQQERSPQTQLLITLAGLALVPLMYGALTPPQWLRSRWLTQEVQREQQRMLLTLPAITWTTDLDLRLLSMNGAGIPATAEEQADSLGRKLEDLWREHEMLEEPAIRQALEMHQRALAGESVTFDSVFQGRAYQSRIDPIRDSDGKVAGAVALSVDITERKKAEDATREAFEREHLAATHLRTLDEMKNAFMSAVSHELRTPLSGVVGFAATLQHGDRLDAEDRKVMLDRLLVNAHKLERLLTDLLDLDRLTRGIVEPIRKPTDVAALVARVVEEWRADVARPVHVSASPVVALLDGPKVERILENLLANAAKYTPHGTPVWVRVEHEDGEVILTVEDAGPGVPEELRASLFEPFQRGDAYVGHAPGFGIGLSLVTRFAQLHGGSVAVSDRVGGGASFRVCLPSAEVERRSATRPWVGATPDVREAAGGSA